MKILNQDKIVIADKRNSLIISCVDRNGVVYLSDSAHEVIIRQNDSGRVLANPKMDGYFSGTLIASDI